MGPKISEAKTPPLKKAASLIPFLSCTLTLLSSLCFSQHLFVPHTLKNHCFAHKCLLREICIHVLSLLSACSKFKHAYGGRMCLWSPWASLQRVLLCLSSSISVLPWQQFFWSLCSTSLITYPFPSNLSISVYFCFSHLLSVTRAHYCSHTYV